MSDLRVVLVAGHHRRAGRGTLLKRSQPSEKAVAHKGGKSGISPADRVCPGATRLRKGGSRRPVSNFSVRRWARR